MTRTAALRVGIFIVVLGVPDGAVGVLWPSMRAAFHRPLGDLGVLVIVMTALYVVGGIVFSRLSHLLPVATVLRASCVLSVASTVAWLAAPTWQAVLGAVASFGLARGVIDSAANAASAGRIRELGWLHAGWAVGGTLGPLLVAATVTGSQWRSSVAVITALSAVVTIGAFVVTRRLAASAEQPIHELSASAPLGVTLFVAGLFTVYTVVQT